MVVSKSLSWNAQEMVRLEHRCYIKKHGMKGQSFEAYFELEFFCATESVVATNIYICCDSNTNSKEDTKLGLQTSRVNENSPHICHATLDINGKMYILVLNSICGLISKHPFMALILCIINVNLDFGLP